MDLPSLEQFNSLVSIITGAFDIAKNLAGSKGTPKPDEANEARAKLIEAELATLGLLKQHKTLIAAYEELEKQVEQLKTWGEEKRDY